jgi:hypothetical protein
MATKRAETSTSAARKVPAVAKEAPVKRAPRKVKTAEPVVEVAAPKEPTIDHSQEVGAKILAYLVQMGPSTKDEMARVLVPHSSGTIRYACIGYLAAGGYVTAEGARPVRYTATDKAGDYVQRKDRPKAARSTVPRGKARVDALNASLEAARAAKAAAKQQPARTK